MKAVSILEAGCVGIVDLAEPTMRPDEVLIEVKYIGLCGSDLNTYRGSSPMVPYPRVPGHEIAGIILDKGVDVPGHLSLGDRVTLMPYTECGHCPACRAGRTNCCQFNETLGVQREGALTVRISVPYRQVYASKTLSLQELALVEPMSVGYHAANRAQISETDTVLIIGCGTIGLGAISAAARKGARVIVSDIDDGKLEIARRFGAQHTINSLKEDVLAVIANLTDGEGVQVAIEAVGLPATYEMAVEAACYAGRVVYIGYAKKPVSYDSTNFVRKELDVRGSRNALHEFPAVIHMIESHMFPFEELITRVYPFEEAGQALADWNDAPGKFTKILIEL